MEQVLDQGVADFVRREFARRHAFLGVCCKTNAAHDALNGIQDVVLFDLFTLASHAVHRGFVANVCNLGARQTGKVLRQSLGVNFWVAVSLGQVNLQNLSPCLDVWKADANFTIESTWPQQRGIE